MKSAKDAVKIPMKPNSNALRGIPVQYPQGCYARLDAEFKDAEAQSKFSNERGPFSPR